MVDIYNVQLLAFDIEGTRDVIDISINNFLAQKQIRVLVIDVSVNKGKRHKNHNLCQIAYWVRLYEFK